jgi:hypothetical protein
MSEPPTVPARVLHILRPQRAGAIGGADLHLLDLAAAQQDHGQYQPLLLVPGASRHYLDRLARAGLSHVAASLPLRRLWSLPQRENVEIVHAHGWISGFMPLLLKTVYAGDDLGDIPAAEAVRELSAAGVTGVVICSESNEPVPEFRARADVVVPGPEGVLRALSLLTGT